MPPKILLTHREALALLSPNFTDGHLRRLARAGLVPGYRPPVRRGTRGGKGYYERAALESWLAAGLPASPTPPPPPAPSPLSATAQRPADVAAPASHAAQPRGDHRRFRRFRRLPA